MSSNRYKLNEQYQLPLRGRKKDFYDSLPVIENALLRKSANHILSQEWMNAQTSWEMKWYAPRSMPKAIVDLNYEKTIKTVSRSYDEL